ncbi:MAG: cysteine--tRNA ligase [Oligoflexia bacterium]|nr:cysteine--tRNA ligase [Oligoflexia bacterium]
MEHPVRLFNTLTRQLEQFIPRAGTRVGIYCCGPTVYDFQHIGNFKTFLFEDLLVRTLRHAGYEVTHVMNITDVGHLVGDGDSGEDKMLVAMRREGKTSWQIADFYTTKFFEDWDKLKLNRPDVVCKATDHIKQMIELAQRLEANGLTYFAGGNLYFDVNKLPDYGKLARLDLEKLKSGARVEIDANKRHPADFVLWFTKSKFENQEMQWDSPWGRGYPGWHIECSAMSMHYLGEQFDIHCGGIDHIPVHHTNEIAQSEGAIQKPWVHFWMHGEFMKINDEKMSKSTGRFIVLDDLIKQGFEPMAYRFLALSSHYRSHLNFTVEAMQNAQNSLNRLKSSVISLRAEAAAPASALSAAAQKYAADFSAAVFDDLNAPRAMAAVWSAIGDKELPAEQKLALVLDFDQVMGLGAAEWKTEELQISPELQAILDRRDVARKSRDWAASDVLRKEALALGFIIEDSATGQKIKKS